MTEGNRHAGEREREGETEGEGERREERVTERVDLSIPGVTANAYNERPMRPGLVQLVLLAVQHDLFDVAPDMTMHTLADFRL